jgi:hypothetical protein
VPEAALGREGEAALPEGGWLSRPTLLKMLAAAPTHQQGVARRAERQGRAAAERERRGRRRASAEQERAQSQV